MPSRRRWLARAASLPLGLLSGLATTGSPSFAAQASPGPTVRPSPARPASAEPIELIVKGGRQGSSYYTMAEQLADVFTQGSQGRIHAVVEDSHGSVSNIFESRWREGNFLFSSPPTLVQNARAGQKPFLDGRFDHIRALIPLPPVSFHMVVLADSPIRRLADLRDRRVFPGSAGSFCGNFTTRLMESLALGQELNLVYTDATLAPKALAQGRIDAFAHCSTHPTPMLERPPGRFRLISLSEEEQRIARRLDEDTAPIVISAATYPWQRHATRTVGMPVGAYVTSSMSEAIAYELTKVFWEHQERLARSALWWKGVDTSLLRWLGGNLHPGARRYYEELGLPAD